MQHLFHHDGEAALAAALGQRPLLAFDFDGTLAPIVAQPDQARISQAVSARLKALATQLPLAIVTGRTVADVRGRLGFEPLYIVGNHGAEDPRDPAAAAALLAALTPVRERLLARQAALAGAGVTVEDKGASLALHYRLARQRERARELIDEALSPPDDAWLVFGGKMVVNVVPRSAPDKSAAVHGLVARCGAACAVFAGDDVNDEPVFESAPPHWLTIRVGRSERHSAARFFLDSPSEMAMLLERMLASLPALRTEPPRILRRLLRLRMEPT
jgi:trehalose 6-phosphate phosphatase